ncbi:MAG: GTPase [Candidatus Hodarchaeales archaeon]|jgi:GTP-binding protein EngB required for normal cell division
MNKIHLIPISGRPNAGKTSLVNFLARTKKPVGKRAGTTRKVFSFPLIKDVSIVDLPGFGRITKRSKSLENKLKDEIIHFFEEPENDILFSIHVIDISSFHHMVDSLERKNIIPLDIEMISFLAETIGVPPIVVFNKVDKVKDDLVDKNIQILTSYDIPEVEIFIVSLKTKEGRRELKNRVKELIILKLGSSYQKW